MKSGVYWLPLIIVFPLMFFLMAQGMNSFLIALICMGTWIVLMLIIGIIGIKIDIKKAKMGKKQFDELNIQLRDTVEYLRNNCETKAITNRTFLNKNSIIMVLCSSESKDRIFYVLKDNENKKCYFLDSKSKKFYLFEPTFKILPLYENIYNYNEKKLVFTGATVGGVTTGGFHEVGGNYSKGKQLTGKHALFININSAVLEENIRIDKIYLDSKLWKQAKCDNISEFIYERNNYIYLQHQLSKRTENNLKSAALVGDTSLDGVYYKMLTRAKSELDLTLKECEDVKDWISNSIKLF